MEGGSNVDGDESGGTSPSRQGADTGIVVPRLDGDGGGDQNCWIYALEVIIKCVIMYIQVHN